MRTTASARRTCRMESSPSELPFRFRSLRSPRAMSLASASALASVMLQADTAFVSRSQLGHSRRSSLLPGQASQTQCHAVLLPRQCASELSSEQGSCAAVDAAPAPAVRHKQTSTPVGAKIKHLQGGRALCKSVAQRCGALILQHVAPDLQASLSLCASVTHAIDSGSALASRLLLVFVLLLPSSACSVRSAMCDANVCRARSSLPCLGPSKQEVIKQADSKATCEQASHLSHT